MAWLCRPRRRGPVAAGLACLFVALAVCAGEDEGGDVLPRPGNPAPAYTVRTLEGDTVSLAQLNGGFVLLNVLGHLVRTVCA